MNKAMILGGLAFAFCPISLSHAADAAAIEKALAAAKTAAAAAAAAEKAAEAAKVAADVARKAAEAAKAAAGAAGLKDTPAAVAEAPTPMPASSAPSGTPTKIGAPLTTSAFLTANTEGGNATIKFEKKSENENFSSSVSMFSISTPLASGAKSADVATLDGLASVANLGYAYTYLRFIDEAENVLSMGLQGRFGQKQFKYFNTTSLAETKADRHSTSLAPYIGYRFEVSGTPLLLQGKFDYQRTYKDADAKILCPQATTFPVTCVNGAAGEPKLTIKQIASVTLRYKTTPLNGEVTVSYDQKSKVKGIDMPMYFIQTKEGDRNFVPFNAGVRLGWRSDTKDTSVGVFIGSPFSFYGP